MTTNTRLTVTSVSEIAPLRIIPVLTIKNVDHVEAIAAAVIKSGIKNIEVTLRTDVSLEALKKFASYSELVVGVGSVKNKDDLSRAVDAGAVFAVSPGYMQEIGKLARDLNVFYLPGVATPTEIMCAHSDGYDVLKFFPAEQLGGISTLSALAPVFPKVRFIPTGGINGKNVNDYLAKPFIAAVGGSWMFGGDLDLSNTSAVEQAVLKAVEELSPVKHLGE
jgi:2-dehydro-3-deoxyphosphogluconate aldolase / (4S)-4-hydroxy-2-oxoglutarate aldolase